MGRERCLLLAGALAAVFLFPAAGGGRTRGGKKSACSGPEAGGPRAPRVALRLKGLGFGKVYALKGGWHEWSAAGFPTERKRR